MPLGRQVVNAEAGPYSAATAVSSSGKLAKDGLPPGAC